MLLYFFVLFEVKYTSNYEKQKQKLASAKEILLNAWQVLSPLLLITVLRGEYYHYSNSRWKKMKFKKKKLSNLQRHRLVNGRTGSQVS